MNDIVELVSIYLYSPYQHLSHKNRYCYGGNELNQHRIN